MSPFALRVRTLNAAALGNESARLHLVVPGDLDDRAASA